jgi:hypothetical protein
VPRDESARIYYHVNIIKNQMAISIRDYQQGDEQKIVDLLTETFNGWPHSDLTCTPLERWIWKFIDNPLKIRVIPLATSDDKVIGCAHDLVQRIKIGEGYYLISQGVDVATHVNYRGMNIWNKLMLHKVKLEKAAGIEFYYAVATNPIIIKWNKRRGDIAFPSPLLMMTRIRDVDAFLKTSHTSNATLKKYGYYGVKMLNKLMTSRARAKVFSGFDDNFEVSEINRFDDDYSMFWDRVKPYYSFIVSRDVDYMNWRYCDPRAGRYIVKIAKIGEQMLGYIILRINRYVEDNPVGYIVDLLVQPDHLNVALKLVEHGIRYFDFENVNIINVSILRNSFFESLLQKMGFIELIKRPYLVIYKEGSRKVIDELFKCDKKSMHFVYGDYDHI